MRNAEQTIGNLIDSQSVSFIGSIDDDGFPNIRAMLTPRKRNGIKEIWFSTNTSSMKVAQFIKNPKACLYFYDKRFYRGVRLIGTMEVLTDPKSRELVWRDGDTMYYPEGINDPDFTVLKFTATKGRFYHDFKNENFDVCQS